MPVRRKINENAAEKANLASNSSSSHQDSPVFSNVPQFLERHRCLGRIYMFAGTLVDVLINIDRVIGQGVVHSLLSDKLQAYQIEVLQGFPNDYKARDC